MHQQQRVSSNQRQKRSITHETLFSSETKEAVNECKKKAACLLDPLPLEQMYDVTPPSPTSTHQLNEHLSRRGESCLESFHLMLAHFGNCGMRTSLADNLNLCGTARYNLSIRHKRHLLTLQNTHRQKIPAAYESMVPFFNHTELHYINRMAIAAGITIPNVPFHRVEILPKDNGERFFSEYLDWMKTTKPGNHKNDLCRCKLCSNPTTYPISQQEGTKTVGNSMHEVNETINTTITTMVTPEASQNNDATPQLINPTPRMVQPIQQVQQVQRLPVDKRAILPVIRFYLSPDSRLYPEHLCIL